jgi:hypothetical protein
MRITNNPRSPVPASRGKRNESVNAISGVIFKPVGERIRRAWLFF